MTWPVIILRGSWQHLTIGSIRYGKFGQRNNQLIILCDTWQQGFEDAHARGFKHALFVKSGTVFLDWDDWCTLLNAYPHQGLVAHIIWRHGEHPYLDDQCWFMDLLKFTTDDFRLTHIQQPIPTRSESNIHDDYTPLWIRPGNGHEEFKSDNFGQGLIAKQLDNGCSIVNWNNTARSIKQFSYGDPTPRTWFAEYIDLAENQLWVLNNESIKVNTVPYIITPGSGLYWMLHACHPEVKVIDIVDISHVQVKFCQELWDNWDGYNYGQFVWDYIKEHKLVHYELNIPALSEIERVKLKSQRRFVDHVNLVFEEEISRAGITDFPLMWDQTKCRVKIKHGNILEYIAQRTDAPVWMSNIMDYKYTLIMTDYKVIEQYEKAIKSATV